MDLHFMTAGQMLALMERGEISSVKLVRLFIERCTALKARFNAVVTLAEERALAQAADSHRRRAHRDGVRAPTLGKLLRIARCSPARQPGPQCHTISSPADIRPGAR